MSAPGWRRAAWWECPGSLVRNSPTAELRAQPWTVSNVPPVSPPTVLWRCLGTLLIFLHLLEETSLLVLLPVGLGACVEVLRTSGQLKVQREGTWSQVLTCVRWRRPAGLEGLQSLSYPAAMEKLQSPCEHHSALLCLSSISKQQRRSCETQPMISSLPPPTEQAKKFDEDEQRTVEYDTQVHRNFIAVFFRRSPSWNPSFMPQTCLSLLQASRCLSYLLFPLCIGGTVFSLAYFRQKRWAAAGVWWCNFRPKLKS